MYRKVLEDYWRLSRRKHKLIDIAIAFCVALIMIVLVRLDSGSGCGENAVLLAMAANISNIVSAVSILAGFNILAVTIFATSSSKILLKLREEIDPDSEKPKIQQIYAYFCWAILWQVAALILFVMYAAVAGYCLSGAPSAYKLPIVRAYAIVIIFCVTYSLSLTLRNIAILYTFLLKDNGK